MRTSLRGLPVATVAAALLLAGCTASGSNSTSADESASSTAPSASASPVLTKPDRDDDLLFVARAASGQLDLDAEGNGTLTMASVPTMTWFSDRPDHDAGTASTGDVLAAFDWKKNGDNLGDGDMAPNAALTGDALGEAVVLELLGTTRDGDDITFDVTVVGKGPKTQRQVELTRTELFIDSVGPTGRVEAGYPTAGEVIGRVWGGCFTNSWGLLAVNGDLVRTPEGKQAVNLKSYAFLMRGGDQLPYTWYTLTEDAPLRAGNPSSVWTGTVINGLKFFPARDGQRAYLECYAPGQLPANVPTYPLS